MAVVMIPTASNIVIFVCGHKEVGNHFNKRADLSALFPHSAQMC